MIKINEIYLLEQFEVHLYTAISPHWLWLCIYFESYFPLPHDALSFNCALNFTVCNLFYDSNKQHLSKFNQMMRVISTFSQTTWNTRSVISKLCVIIMQLSLVNTFFQKHRRFSPGKFQKHSLMELCPQLFLRFKTVF